MKAIRAMVTGYPLIFFYLSACVFSWIAWWTPDSLFERSIFVWLPVAAFVILARGPLAASLIVTALRDGKPGVLVLLRKFIIWRVGWRWYAFALLVAPSVALAALYANALFGAPTPASILSTTLPAILGAFALRLVNPLDGPMEEELGWRGFALPRLQARYSTLVAFLVLGVMAIGWHLPLVLRGDFPAFALLGTLAQTVVFSWLCFRTRGSVLLPLIAHAADGLLRPELAGTDLTRYWVLLVGSWCVVAAVVIIRDWPRLMRKPKYQIKDPTMPQPVAV